MRLSPRGTWAVAVLLLASWGVLTVLSIRSGWTGTYSTGEILRGVAATFDLAEPLQGSDQDILRLRLWRALTAGAVGASLALAGGYLQGLFRNGLASPAVLGVTAGSVLGASIATSGQTSRTKRALYSPRPDIRQVAKHVTIQDSTKSCVKTFDGRAFCQCSKLSGSSSNKRIKLSTQSLKRCPVFLTLAGQHIAFG